MGIRNYLIEGVSGSGKTTVCDELLQRGYHAIHGDRELAYQGDPVTGEPLDGFSHDHHIWDVAKVSAHVDDDSQPATFFCGGSRNFDRFMDLFDQIFVLEIDLETLTDRLSERPETEWGGSEAERAFIRRRHQSREDVPTQAISIDATKPVERVVDDILARCGPLTGS